MRNHRRRASAHLAHEDLDMVELLGEVAGRSSPRYGSSTV
jgi:hypothetical protein